MPDDPIRSGACPMAGAHKREDLPYRSSEINILFHEIDVLTRMA